jgi:hypothetical protein
MDGAVAAKLFHLNLIFVIMTINTLEKLNTTPESILQIPLQLLSNIIF